MYYGTRKKIMLDVAAVYVRREMVEKGGGKLKSALFKPAPEAVPRSQKTLG